jgi:hypothetical protein
VTSLGVFAGAGRNIDIVGGPDGALYYAPHRTNLLYRIAYTNGPQKLVVSPIHLNMAEGGIGVVDVSLAQRPDRNVLVTVTTNPENSQIRALNTQLSFTPKNYSGPQPVYVQALDDSDTFGSRGSIILSSSGLADQQVFVNAYDPQGGMLRFASIAHSGNEAALQIATERNVGVYLESSINFSSWQRLSTNVATNDLMKMVVPAPVLTNQFYRARAVPQ